MQGRLRAVLQSMKGLHERPWSTPKTLMAMTGGFGAFTYIMCDPHCLVRMRGPQKRLGEEIPRNRNYHLFYYVLGVSLQAYSAFVIVFFKTALQKSVLRLAFPSILFGYLAQKLDSNDWPLEKHMAWLSYNTFFGLSVGHFTYHASSLFRATNNEFFVLWGYALLYISGYIFQSQYVVDE